MEDRSKKLPALQKTLEPYQDYYNDAKTALSIGGCSALRMQIGRLDASISSAESSLSTQKSLPNIVLALTSVFVSGMVLLFTFYTNIKSLTDVAAMLRATFGEEADRYIQSFDVDQMIAEVLSHNETIMLCTGVVCGILMLSVLVSVGTFLLGLNKKKREIDLYRIQRAAYQQLLDEVLNGEIVVANRYLSVRT